MAVEEILLIECIELIAAGMLHMQYIDTEVAWHMRKFRAFFGVSPYLICCLWQQLFAAQLLGEDDQPKHLMWMLLWLKVYATEEALTNIAGCKSEKTFRKWVHIYLVRVGSLDVVRLLLPLEDPLSSLCSLTNLFHSLDHLG